ncbi:hypothetical protein Bca52824_053771 [Brassica carinata]|uniref:Uncharacterized protein n=1 Tax=Brassica carinata TaxID=52824 RepID=A0A8X7R688_BRACI|nr:hypothetical protein Bca52824_053771 [Brassica carinata]
MMKGDLKPHIEQVAERSTPEETEEDRRCRLKGKAIEVDDGAKETHTSSVLVANRSLHTTEQRITNILENQPATGGTDKLAIAESNDKEQEMEEDLQLPSEEEMRQFEEQYASVNFEMDEEMLDEDDLLDEVENKEIVVPETQEVTQKSTKEQNNQGTEGGDVSAMEKTS